MRNKSLPVKYLVLSIIIVLLLISGTAAWVFFHRPPLLIVTDISFSQLYGPERLKRQNRNVSLSLFRQVIPVLVDEIAGPGLVAIAAEEAHETPWAVIFPSRYIEGARRYIEEKPELPVLIMGSSPRIEGETFSMVHTDAQSDLYRAGMAAALLTGDKTPLFYSDGALPDAQREAFLKGLGDQGFSEEPVFLNASSGYPSYSEIGCVIIAGPAARFAEQNLDIPVILFSWFDPGMTPWNVKIVFDDSPWTLAVNALKALPAEEITLPSSPLIIRDRIEDKGVFTRLKDLILKK